MSDVKELEYVVLTPDDLPAVADLLANYYYPRENLCKGSGVLPVDPTAGLEGQDIVTMLASGLSIGAREKTTGKLVGVTTNISFTSPPELKEEIYGSDPMAIAFRLVGMCWKLVDVFQEPGVDQVLEIQRACVHPDYGRRGVLKEMAKKCMDLASKQGCQLAHIEITSPYSEAACIRLGFETRATIDLQTLEEGLLDLSLMNYKVMKVMTRRLPAKTTAVPSV